ncbi:MAG: PQQ-binding-like beta-propeller repeat protein [bacterium]|nr:PQQ-binding-like beta-propeller repeat protein [bacterium]
MTMMFARLAGTALMAAILAPTCLSACKSAPAAEPKVQPTAETAPKSANFPVDHDSWAKLGYRLDWVGFPFARQGRNPKILAIRGYDDVIFALESDSTIAVLETATGQRRWATDLAGPLTRFVSLNRDVVDPSRVLVSSESEVFLLSIANGNILGRERFEQVVNTRAIVEGPMAVYGTSKGQILAHHLGIGVKAWGFGTDDPIDAAPVRVGNSILVINQAGAIVVLTPEGQLVGRNKIFGGTAGDPVSDGHFAFIAGLDQSVWAFDQVGGLAWRYRTPAPLRVQPATFGDTVYVEVRGQGLTALAAADGTVKWSNKDIGGTVIASNNGSLLVWNAATSSMALIDAARGDTIHSAPVAGIKQIFTDSADGAPLYAVSDKGVLARFVRR